MHTFPLPQRSMQPYISLRRYMQVICCAAILTCTTIPPTHAEEASKEDSLALPGTFSGNVGFVSDYSFRGISQTREKPALQGGVDYKHPSGAYAGAWGSSVDFNDSDHASVEIDGYIGFTRAIIDTLSADTHITYYAYPGAPSSLRYNYYELYAALTYGFDIPTITGSMSYSPDNFGGSGEALYTALSVTCPLVYGFSLNGHVGRQFIDDQARFGVPSYNEWATGVTYEWQPFTLGLQYIDTNLRGNQCADGCDPKVLASLAYTF